jgi:Tfp pilus assembly protein PilO
MSRRALFISGAAALAVLLVWYMALWRPRQADISTQRQRVEAAEGQRSDLEVRLARLKSLKRDEALKRSQLERLRVAIPDQPNLAQFILDANDAANKAGIEFLSITPTQPTPGADGGAASVGLAMTISGGYFQVLEYLNRVDEMPRIVVFDSINLTPASNKETPEAMSVALSGRMFSTGVPATPAPSPAQPGAAGPAASAGAAGATPTTVPGPGVTATGAAPTTVPGPTAATPTTVGAP